MKQQHFLLIVFLFFFYAGSAQSTDTAALRLNNYRDKVFSVFNKCRTHDDEITAAIKAKKPNGIEQGRTALLQCAIEGMKELDSIKDLDSDPALKFSCRDVLKFYKQLAESDLTKVRDFFILEEHFFTIKKEFEKKSARKHLETEVLAYNNEVKKYNASLLQYTQLNNFIVNSRKLTLYNWYASIKIFMDAHTPKS